MEGGHFGGRRQDVQLHFTFKTITNSKHAIALAEDGRTAGEQVVHIRTGAARKLSVGRLRFARGTCGCAASAADMEQGQVKRCVRRRAHRRRLSSGFILVGQFLPDGGLADMPAETAMRRWMFIPTDL